MRKGRITSALLVFMMLFLMTSCKKKEKFSVTKYVQETDLFFFLKSGTILSTRYGKRTGVTSVGSTDAIR